MDIIIPKTVEKITNVTPSLLQKKVKWSKHSKRSSLVKKSSATKKRVLTQVPEDATVSIIDASKKTGNTSGNKGI